MIPVHMEPKGLDRDAIAIAGNYENESRADAAVGSAMLRDAILRSMGLAVPVQPRPKPKLVIVKSDIRPHQRTDCCEKCGQPVAPDGRLVADIQATVSGYYGLHPSAMTSARRGFDVAHPRQIAMYLAAELTPKSLPAIGKRFGGRDHTTVIHAIKAVKKRIAEDPEVAEDVRVLRAVLA